jgi:Zn ribbon nucleic-acid-binding protein
MEIEHTDLVAEQMIADDERERQEAEEAAVLELLRVRAAKALTEAKDLIVHVRTIALQPRTERGEVLREWSAPAPLQKIDDADEFWSQLIDWAVFWGETLDRPVPKAARAARAIENGEVQAFRAGTTPEQAGQLVGILATQLAVWLPEIGRQAAAREFYIDAAELVSKLRSRYPQAPRPERPVSPRACPVCGRHEVGAWWRSGNPHDVVVECGHCGHEIPARTIARVVDWVVGASNCLHRFPAGGGVCEKCFAVVSPLGAEIDVDPAPAVEVPPAPVRAPLLRPHASNFLPLGYIDERDATRPVCGRCWMLTPCDCDVF